MLIQKVLFAVRLHPFFVAKSKVAELQKIINVGIVYCTIKLYRSIR